MCLCAVAMELTMKSNHRGHWGCFDFVFLLLIQQKIGQVHFCFLLLLLCLNVFFCLTLEKQEFTALWPRYELKFLLVWSSCSWASSVENGSWKLSLVCINTMISSSCDLKKTVWRIWHQLLVRLQTGPAPSVDIMAHSDLMKKHTSFFQVIIL